MFNQFLIGKNASREEVKLINDTIFDLIDKARDKQDDAMHDRDAARKFLTEHELIA